MEVVSIDGTLNVCKRTVSKMETQNAAQTIRTALAGARHEIGCSIECVSADNAPLIFHSSKRMHNNENTFSFQAIFSENFTDSCTRSIAIHFGCGGTDSRNRLQAIDTDYFGKPNL